MCPDLATLANTTYSDTFDINLFACVSMEKNGVWGLL
jgi:hypothetical protein